MKPVVKIWTFGPFPVEPKELVKTFYIAKILSPAFYAAAIFDHQFIVLLVSTKAQLGFSMPLFLPNCFFAFPTITVWLGLVSIGIWAIQ